MFSGFCRWTTLAGLRNAPTAFSLDWNFRFRGLLFLDMFFRTAVFSSQHGPRPLQKKSDFEQTVPHRAANLETDKRDR
jgi:hypothetical protein